MPPWLLVIGPMPPRNTKHSDEAAVDEYCRIGSIFDVDKTEDEEGHDGPDNRPGYSGPYKPEAMQYGGMTDSEYYSVGVAFVPASTTS